MKPNELQGAAQQTGGIITALAGLIGSAVGGYNWLAPNLVEVVGETLAPLLGAGLPFAAVLALALWVWRRTRSISRLKRPEAFELKATRPEDLVGRERDVQDLQALIEERPLVFLVGESGAGKTALVTAGLLPLLRQQGRLLPVLVSRYGTDWSDGPASETVQTLWEASEKVDRQALHKLWKAPDPDKEENAPHKPRKASDKEEGKEERATWQEPTPPPPNAVTPRPLGQDDRVCSSAWQDAAAGLRPVR